MSEEPKDWSHELSCRSMGTKWSNGAREVCGEMESEILDLRARCEFAEQTVREWRRAAGAAADAGNALVERVSALELALREAQDTLCSLTNASVTELRCVVETQRLDTSSPAGIYGVVGSTVRSCASDAEWEVARRVSGWFQARTLAAVQKVEAALADKESGK